MNIEIPGQPTTTISHLVLDFNGTLACDGVLLPGVAPRLSEIATRVKIIVLTADTFGTAARSLKEMPCELRQVRSGLDKAELVRQIGAAHVIAIGNGYNDADMVRQAAIGIAVIGPEGASGDLIQAARVVVRDICDALDLVLKPLRLTATLRL